MTVWTWALIALCAAGAALAFAACAIALVSGMRLSRRLSELRDSPFVTKLESLQIQVARLSRTSDDAERLRARAEAALHSLREAPKVAGFAELAGAWRNCAGQLKDIIAELS